MTFSIIHRASGNVVASYATERAALTWIAKNIEPDDEWALVEFGPKATDNRLLATWPSEDDGSSPNHLEGE